MFTLPLNDDNPTTRTAVVTYALIGACVVVFLYQASLTPRDAQALVYGLGVVPESLFGGKGLPRGVELVPSGATLVTYLFLHGGWLHLGGNMLYLWIFGNNVEDAMGHVRFVMFYLVCGAAAGLAHSLSAPGSMVPMIGASGAIGGVLGAYLLLYPRANVRVLLWLFVFVRIINVPAWIVLGLWFVLQFVSGATISSAQGGVAFWAHVGGFVAGMVLIALFKYRTVPLFASPRSTAFQTASARTIARRDEPAAQRATPTAQRRGSVPPARTNRRGLPWDNDRGLPWDDRR